MRPIATALLFAMAGFGLALGGCAAKDPASLEAAFEREKPNLTQVELDPREDSCRGTGAAAFLRGREVVMIEHVVGTSTRWFLINYDDDGGRLRLAVQRTWWLKDDDGDDLAEPRAESTTRFFFEPGREPRMTGDEPPDATDATQLANDAADLLALARAK